MKLFQSKLAKSNVKLALLAIPLQIVISTTPIFLVSGNPQNMLPYIWGSGFILLSVVWYVNYNLYFFAKTGRQYYIFSFIFVVAFVSIIRVILLEIINLDEQVIKNGNVKQIPPYLVSYLLGITNNSMILLLQELLRTRFRQIELMQNLSKLEYQNIQSQFQNLKNQIQPHFLFNALNSLKILIKKRPEEAEKYLLKLSDFLRASIEKDKQSTQTIREDLLTAENYLDIQMVRFSKGIIFSKNLSDNDLDSLYVPIFTFQILIENALKHNIFSEESPIIIEIFKEGKEIFVKNSLSEQPKRVENSNKIGLVNLDERFILLSKNKIEILQTNTSFTVSFIPFKEQY